MIDFFIGVIISAAVMFVVFSLREKNLKNDLTDERRFRGAFESIPYYIAFDDKGSTDLYANPAACKMIGLPVGNPIFKEASHDAEHMTFLQTVCIPAAYEKGVWVGENELLHCDGHSIPVWQSVFPVKDSQGNVRGLGTIMRDVTEEKEIRRMLDIQSSITASSTAFMAALDLDLKIRYINDGAYVLLGYKPNEIELLPELMFDPEDLSFTLETQKKVLETCVPSKIDTKMRKKDGSQIYTENSYFPIFSEQHIKIGIGILISDVTQLIRMQKELLDAKEQAEAASNSKSSFLSHMSHEIRTPMNAIIGMTELLLAEKLTQQQNIYAQNVLQSGKTLLELINDILDFSKIEAGMLELTNINYDLHELISNLDNVFSITANEKGINFSAIKSDDVPVWLEGDDLRLRQILTNIIGNAIKFTKEGGVTLKVKKEGHYIVFEIIDTGIGIKADDLPKLFTEFMQLNTSANRSIKGTGLGLAISKRLVELMGGIINLNSKFGKGTIFIIKIPYIKGKPLNGDDLKSEILVKAPNAKILVVDDNAVNLMVAKGLLTLCKIRTDLADSGAQAIEMIGKKDYDLVFMDHMMPEMDGIEATNKIRSRLCTAEKMPIIALSANAVEGMREQYLSAGMQDLLVKPIEKKLLNAILKKWLKPELIEE